MKTMSRLALVPFLLFLGCASTPTTRHKIVSETLNYEAGGAKCTGYICYDAEVQGKRPGVLVVHEWWGHNEYVRERARMLAEMGYVAMSLDMYGDGKLATHPDDAGKFAGEVSKNMPVATARFTAAKDLLANYPPTDPHHIAAIGYCFGGGVVLNMARAGMDLDAVASFHGSLGTATPAKKGAVKARVLVCHGGDDQFTTPEQIAAFKQEMTDADVNMEFVTYPGAKHGFTSKESDANGKKFGLPLAYDAAADKASWAELTEFLAQTWQ